MSSIWPGGGPVLRKLGLGGATILAAGTGAVGAALLAANPHNVQP